MESIDIENISKEFNEEGNNLLNFTYGIITYPNDYLQSLTDEKIYQILEKHFYYVGAYCENDNEIDHNHFHYFVMTKNKNRKQFRKGPKTFDIPLNENFVSFYKPFTGRNGKEERKLVGCERYSSFNNSTSIALKCSQLGGTTYEIIDTAHPNLRIMKKKNTQQQILNYIFKQILDLDRRLYV